MFTTEQIALPIESVEPEFWRTRKSITSPAVSQRIQVSVLLSCEPVPVLMISVFCEVITKSEEHTSELQSLMRISYAVFCLKKKKKNKQRISLYNITSIHYVNIK